MINSTDEFLGFFQVKPIKINEYILIFHAKFIKPPFNMSYPLHLAFMMSYTHPPRCVCVCVAGLCAGRPRACFSAGHVPLPSFTTSAETSDLQRLTFPYPISHRHGVLQRRCRMCKAGGNKSNQKREILHAVGNCPEIRCNGKMCS